MREGRRIHYHEESAIRHEDRGVFLRELVWSRRMLVYGDRAHRTTLGEKFAALRLQLLNLKNVPLGIERHAALAGAFISAAELAQGVADAEFERLGVDTNCSAERQLMGLLSAVAIGLQRSWETRFAAETEVNAMVRGLDAFVEDHGPHLQITCKVAEGYAHYAVYPESYLAAGKELASNVLCIGIRSIGLGLSVLASTGANAVRSSVSVRPIGHPFARVLALSPEFSRELLAHMGPFAIVDEGPGLSGSSFGAVADYLEDEGSAADRIHFVPSHRNAPGPQASQRHRARWEKARCHLVDFDDLALRAVDPRHHLAGWVDDVTGPAELPLKDFSGGGWREQASFAGEPWPPSITAQERRKFLLTSSRGRYLLKFCGLGVYGEQKLKRARALSEAGFTPAPLAFRHGFLVEPWLAFTTGVPVGFDRQRLVRRLASYLGFRARHFSAAEGSGAPLTLLHEMARVNVREALDPPWGAALDRWMGRLTELQRSSSPVEVDGRLHRWEWLLRDDGALIKTDALDHHAGHDLVGCQDIAWDVAGAIAEFDLADAEAAELRDRLTHEGDAVVNPALIEFLRPCYLAFQLGLWCNAEAGVDYPESLRIRARVESLRRQLRTFLTATS